MDIDVYAEGWRQKSSAEEAARRGRASELVRRASAVARVLEALGARRVVLFGSLARGRPHARSDMDLAVEGLPGDRLLQAIDEAQRAAGDVAVDIVRVEEAPPRLRHAIEAGKVLSAQ